MVTDLILRSVAFEAEVRIAAAPDDVWAALTKGVGDWWPHTFTDAPVRVGLEAVIGGRFYEQFDESGAGALYAHVTYVEPGRVLRTSGPMGMSGAVVYVKTYRLEPVEAGTIVRTSVSALGAIDEETVEGYRSGGEAVLEALRGHLEGTAIART